MIEAFHSNWTAPFLSQNKDKKYYVEDFEILITILSALKWREKNGSIKMVTDEIGAEFYRKINIDSIWDIGIDVSLDKISKKINPEIFWAAGKIYSLKKQNSPCVMIDTDFIVWESIYSLLNHSEISVIHKELISPEVYPGKEHFKFKKGYNLKNIWNWDILPCNTAFMFINNEDLKNYYTKSSIDFMKNVIDSNDRIINMVFAEQRLISMCADDMGIEINELMNLDILSKGTQNYFTHIWGYKNQLKINREKRKNFCIKCIKRILKDFPEYEDIIANMNEVMEYYKYIKEL